MMMMLRQLLQLLVLRLLVLHLPQLLRVRQHCEVVAGATLRLSWLGGSRCRGRRQLFGQRVLRPVVFAQTAEAGHSWLRWMHLG